MSQSVWIVERELLVHQTWWPVKVGPFDNEFAAQQAMPDNSGLYRVSEYRRVEEKVMSYEEAMQVASRDESFRATVYAMNTLLIHRGIYTQEEFESLFAEWVGKEKKNK